LAADNDNAVVPFMSKRTKLLCLMVLFGLAGLVWWRLSSKNVIEARGQLQLRDPRVVAGNNRNLPSSLDQWVIEIQVPQESFEEIRRAIDNPDGMGVLDVDVLLASEPTSVYRAKLEKQGLITMNQAATSADVVTIRVRLHAVGNDIALEDRVPKHSLLAWLSARVKIHCQR
jgi:hypothetical protein